MFFKQHYVEENFCFEFNAAPVCNQSIKIIKLVLKNLVETVRKIGHLDHHKSLIQSRYSRNGNILLRKVKTLDRLQCGCKNKVRHKALHIQVLESNVSLLRMKYTGHEILQPKLN